MNADAKPSNWWPWWRIDLLDDDNVIMGAVVLNAMDGSVAVSQAIGMGIRPLGQRAFINHIPDEDVPPDNFRFRFLTLAEVAEAFPALRELIARIDAARKANP